MVDEDFAGDNAAAGAALVQQRAVGRNRSLNRAHDRGSWAAAEPIWLARLPQ